MNTPEAIERLIKALGRLPSIGRRSAERIALRLVQDRKGLIEELIGALTEASRTVVCCSRCGHITRTTEDPCRLCTDPKRDDSLLCVVESPGDILQLEEAGGYRGRYHALMARISPMKGEGVDDMRVDALVKRIRSEGIKEVILAVNTDVESDATASFLKDVLDRQGVKVSRLALGLPAGSGITYSDPVTLSRALRMRQEI